MTLPMTENELTQQVCHSPQVLLAKEKLNAFWQEMHLMSPTVSVTDYQGSKAQTTAL